MPILNMGRDIQKDAWDHSIGEGPRYFQFCRMLSGPRFLAKLGSFEFPIEELASTYQVLNKRSIT